MWKRIKTLLRTRLIGQRNADRLSFAYRVASRTSRRLARDLYRQRRRADHSLRRYSVHGHHTFFGYYDVTPFDHGGERLLAMAVPPINRTPVPTDEIAVGYFDLVGSGRFHEVGRTTTWCWQQGCRLRWWPGDEDRIIYNTLVDDEYGCVVRSASDGAVLKTLPAPVYDIESSGRWALSLDFSRLQRLRPGYGYASLRDRTEGLRCPKGNGIWLIDTETGDSRLVIELTRLLALESQASMVEAEHYVNHISFAPSGDRFMFFHLWLEAGKLSNRLIVSDREGEDVRVVEDRGSVSHYAWKNDDELLVTVNFPDRSCRYYLYRIGQAAAPVRIGRNVLTVDGHPSYRPGSESLLTDTYPDEFGEQRLMIYEPDGELAVLGRYRLPLRYRGETRCDLHPRWNQAGTRICFDSSHSGMRALYVKDV